jgi:hypothetical protein
MMLLQPHLLTLSFLRNYLSLFVLPLRPTLAKNVLPLHRPPPWRIFHLFRSAGLLLAVLPRHALSLLARSRLWVQGKILSLWIRLITFIRLMPNFNRLIMLLLPTMLGCSSSPLDLKYSSTKTTSRRMIMVLLLQPLARLSDHLPASFRLPLVLHLRTPSKPPRRV